MNKQIKLPNFNLSVVKNIVLFIVLGSLTFSAGYFFGIKGFEAQLKEFPKVTISRQTPPDKNIDFSLFWKVWDRLETSYFDKSKIVPSKMVYGAISGMVSALGDPYTTFLTPQENKVVQEDLSGNFEGVGIQIGFKGTQLAVIAPLPGTPAEKAGIKAGDYIVGIKDEKKGVDRGTVGISLPDAVQAIRGPRGTKVTLLLLRDGAGEAIEVEVVRERINVPSVILTFENEGKIAHLRLLKFGGETDGEWARVAGEVATKCQALSTCKGLVLDLRNNPGGYLEGSVDIASEFIKTGIVVIEENADGRREEFKVARVGKLTEIPLVVLVNKGSASASEILAGALKDHNRAKLVGEVTFGKGTIQEPQQVNGGAGLHITIARWLTPSGFWVNEKGLEPDVKIEDNLETSADEQLQEAIKLLI